MTCTYGCTTVDEHAAHGGTRGPAVQRTETAWPSTGEKVEAVIVPGNAPALRPDGPATASPPDPQT